jgi:hypothetical protein
MIAATQSPILGSAAKPVRRYNAFTVRQIDSDGSIADSNGFCDADEQAASVHIANSPGSDGGDTSTLGIVPVVLAGAALPFSIAGMALGRRPLV